MSLPEPNFIERDIDKITQEWIEYYEGRTGKTLEPAQVERILIDLGVYRENLLRIEIQRVALQNLVNFSSGAVLEALGELVGVYKLGAEKTPTVIKFTLNEVLNFDLTIPANVQIESKDGNVTYITQKEFIISAGEISGQVDSLANIAGIIANGYLPGEINNLITPLPYVAKAENISTTEGGADEETDEQLRLRIKEAPEQFSNAGSKGAYRFHTMSAHPSIIDVAVVTKQPGVVQVYPLTKEGSPTNEVITAIKEHLTDEKVRPLTDLVLVSAPQSVDFEIVAELTLYDYADKASIEKLIKEKIKEYRKSLKEKLGKDIVPTQIITLLNSIYGVYKVELTKPFYQELDTSQWANLTNDNINIGGYVSG